MLIKSICGDRGDSVDEIGHNNLLVPAYSGFAFMNSHVLEKRTGLNAACFRISPRFYKFPLPSATATVFVFKFEKAFSSSLCTPKKSAIKLRFVDSLPILGVPGKCGIEP